MLPAKSPRPPIEELIIYVLLVITGVTATIGAAHDVGPVGAEATIGFLMIVTGLIGVVAYAWRFRRGRTP